MADIRPLRGVRFDPRRSGLLGPLIAPPYDVASAAGTVSKFSIRNIEAVNLAMNGQDHAIAARRYREWLRDGVLRQDGDPSIYVHRHAFDLNGSTVVRTGLLTRVRLADWTDGIVLPHERTTPGPREERLQRLRSVHANLSPLYFLYGDPLGEVRNLIDHLAPDAAAPVVLDQMGGTHNVAPIVDASVHAELARVFASRTLFVADGHHRYEAALAYRDEYRRDHGVEADAPSEFILALLAAVDDPGVVIRPTHRLLVGDQAVSPESILALLRRWFVLRPATNGAAQDEIDRICRVVLPGSDEAWDVHARPGHPHMSLLPRDRGTAWRSLDIAAVQGVLESIAGGARSTAMQRVIPVVDADDASRRVRGGSAQAAFLLPPPRLDRLLAVAEDGDLLPAKSTWFEPKAPAGLVINDLRRHEAQR